MERRLTPSLALPPSPRDTILLANNIDCDAGETIAWRQTCSKLSPPMLNSDRRSICCLACDRSSATLTSRAHCKTPILRCTVLKFHYVCPPAHAPTWQNTALDKEARIALVLTASKLIKDWRTDIIPECINLIEKFIPVPSGDFLSLVKY